VYGHIDTLHELENLPELIITRLQLYSLNTQSKIIAYDNILSKMRSLMYLKLNRNALKSLYRSGIFSSTICRLPIKELDLSSCDADNHHMSAISKMSSLEKLILCDNAQVSDTGLKHLCALPNLKSLDLRFCWRITPVGLSYMKKTECEELAITHGGIDDECLLAISHMKELRKLHLRDNPAIHDADIVHVLRLNKLELLDIRGCINLVGSGLPAHGNYPFKILT